MGQTGLVSESEKEMPSIARGIGEGIVYHVIDRGNGRQEVFHKEKDYMKTRNKQHYSEITVGATRWVAHETE
ncbi:MAG: hypothetical protein HZB33_06560 [Nitrospirae bacterium]|nr:hypothetical protein [Nitrospirota bacterium]